MSTTSGLEHAAERLHRWPHSRRHGGWKRRHDAVCRAAARELATVREAQAELAELPPRTRR